MEQHLWHLTLFSVELQGSAPVNSVLHAGGALADSLIPNQTAAGARTAFAAKAFGGKTLAALMAAAPFASLQLFSSISGTLGNAGQANYTAANGVLDSLATQLQVRREDNSKLDMVPCKVVIA